MVKFKIRTILLPLVFITIIACSDERHQLAAETTVPEAPKQTAGDPVKGKALSSNCVSCHGAEGATSSNGAPFIAGQKIKYLKAAMLDYRRGARTQKEMQFLTAKLDESNIDDLAAYYSALKTTWDPLPYRPKVTQKPRITKADIEEGKRLSGSCVGCHGETGNSMQAGIPSLAGLQPEYIVGALKSYFNATRHEAIMKIFKQSMDTREMEKLAAYFNAQERVRAKTSSAGHSKKGQSIAETKCVGCHGIAGNSGNATMPSLSGQNADYLVKALTAYKDGSRKNKMMQDVIKDVSSKHFNDIAAYYAAQEPQRYDPQPSTSETGFDPIGQGEKLAQACTGCHGNKGNSSTVGIPSLTRLHPEYLKKAITAYIDGTRKHSLMASFVKSLSEDDKEKIALYFATQDPANSKHTLKKSDKTAAESIAATCNGCHGTKGNSSQVNTPSLAGQDPQYLLAALKGYQSAQRQQQDMQNVVKDLKEADMVNLAAFYAAQEAVKPEVHIPNPPEVIAAKCDRCHGENGFSAVLDIPRIGGQLESYLLDSLLLYKNQTRDHAVMYAMADGMSVLEIKAIARYYSDQKP